MTEIRLTHRNSHLRPDPLGYKSARLDFTGALVIYPCWESDSETLQSENETKEAKQRSENIRK